jgi:hypothetical protein
VTTNPLPPDADDLGRRLDATLHRHLDAVTASADLTGAAVTRSHRIRRNRMAAMACAVALAAVSVAAPLAWSSLRSPEQKPFVPGTTAPSDLASSSIPTRTGPAPVTGHPTTTTAPSDPSGTAGPTGTGASAPSTSAPTGPSIAVADNGRPPLRSVVLPSRAPSGPTPDIAWSFGSVLHRGTSSVTLDVGDDWSYTPLAAGTGVLMDNRAQQGGAVRIIAADGTTLRNLVAIPAGQGAQIRANGSGTRFTVYVSRSGVGGSDARITTYRADGTVVAAKSNLRRDVTVVGLVGDRVFLANENVGRSFVWDLHTNLINRYTNTGLIKAVNEPTGRAALWTADSDVTRGCTEILDVTGPARTVSESCGTFFPRAFSPDGSSLVGFPANTDGYGAVETDVLDVALGRVALRIVGAIFPMDSVFLPDGSVGLNAVRGYGLQGTTNSLVSCSLVGHCTTWVDVVPMNSDLATPYRLHP